MTMVCVGVRFVAGDQAPVDQALRAEAPPGEEMPFELDAGPDVASAGPWKIAEGIVALADDDLRMQDEEEEEDLGVDEDEDEDDLEDDEELDEFDEEEFEDEEFDEFDDDEEFEDDFDEDEDEDEDEDDLEDEEDEEY